MRISKNGALSTTEVVVIQGDGQNENKPVTITYWCSKRSAISVTDIWFSISSPLVEISIPGIFAKFKTERHD